MNKLGIRNTLLVSGLVMSIVLAGAGCSRKLSDQDPVITTADAAQTSYDPMSFSAIDAKIREYNFGINEYMREHSDEATSKVSQGATPGGVSANCTYTISADGKYEALQMEKNIVNGTQIDEYFNLGDALFIARTTVYDDGNFDPVDKYYITGGTIYKLDGSASTVTKIADLSDPSAEETKANIDIYTDFDEIRAIYA